MLGIFAVIFLGIEHKLPAWYADGAAVILLQFQSIHIFDPASQGVHPMSYGVLAGWFLLQMVVSVIVFIPLRYFLEGKKKALQTEGMKKGTAP